MEYIMLVHCHARFYAMKRGPKITGTKMKAGISDNNANLN